MDKARNSVLIVDDEKANIIALTHILSPEYLVYAAKNGQDAIETAEEYLPDVILLDILMPEMDGYAVIAALKLSEKTRNISVIFVTGLSSADDEEKGLALGASDYIIKPFSPAIVKLRVRNQVKIREQMRLIIEKELAEKSNHAKLEFLSRMSHEMLTPMNTIMGMARILKTSGGSRETEEYLDKIGTASRHLFGLINNLLDISDNNSSALTLTDSVFSFKTMFQNILREIGRNAAKKQQKLVIDIDPSMPTLLGDEERFAQVIENLLANAIKFTGKHGEINFSARVLNEENGAVNLQIEITDNGIGISKEQQNEIFSIFGQADGSITRKHEGIGLGLPLSKRIIEMMGGKIWVDSEPGKGSKFIFSCKMQKG